MKVVKIQKVEMDLILKDCLELKTMKCYSIVQKLQKDYFLLLEHEVH